MSNLVRAIKGHHWLAVACVVAIVLLVAGSFQLGATLRRTPERVAELERFNAELQADRQARIIERCESDHRIAEQFRQNARTLVAAASMNGPPDAERQARIDDYLAAVDRDAAAIDCTGPDLSPL